MKKRTAAVLGACAVLLTACGGTKIPTNEKLKKNMEKKSYTVKITEDDSLGSILTAKKDDAFLYIYRFNKAEDTATFYDMYASSGIQYDRLYQFQDDSKVGNV
ncbi:MAG: hypothetical protein J5722_05780, partial [Oscillospiraceae bacterium]|nr:hypothetical protein [Oscillospiraceae bacterium]